jgi:hypothetical protein
MLAEMTAYVERSRCGDGFILSLHTHNGSFQAEEKCHTFPV